MVGDQPSDADAARANGTNGMMIAPPGSWVAPFVRVDTFAEAAEVLKYWMAPAI